MRFWSLSVSSEDSDKHEQMNSLARAFPAHKQSRGVDEDMGGILHF